MPGLPFAKDGQVTWSLTIDDEGEREYKVTHLVVGTPGFDGPYNASRASGLPTIGSIWSFDGEFDIWAFCRPGASVKPHEEKPGDPVQYWIVEQTFSTKPVKRCVDDLITDPLLIPPKINATTQKDKEEAMYDRFGIPVVNSAHEQIRGPQNEWDVSRTQIKIEQNVLTPERQLIEPMRDSLNDRPMWGYPKRAIKLSDFSWEEKFYGSCYKYYTRSMTFDVRIKVLNVLNPFPVPGVDPIPGPLGTLLIPDWDRDLLDEGTKVLYGRWDATVGTGQDVTITSVDTNGGITGVSLAGTAGGYPKNAVVPLYVDLPDPLVGRRAVILVQTDDTGTTVSIVRISLPGAGYGIAVTTTTQRGNWVLRTIWGFVPNPDNPQYFMRSVDAKGNQMRLLLDGKGMPIGEDETPGHIHVAKYQESNFLLLGLPDLPD